MDGTRSIPLHGRDVAIRAPSVSRFAAMAGLGFLSAAALLIALRRIAGALDTSLDPATLLTIGILISATAVAIRLAWFLPTDSEVAPRLDQAIMIATTLSAAILGAGLCVPGTSAAGMAMFCTLLAVEESWAWAWRLRSNPEATILKTPRVVRLDPAHASSPRIDRSVAVTRPVLMLEPEIAEPLEDVLQQLTRSRTADGVEQLSGWLRLAFSADQRTGSIHVAFCPPFEATPELEIEQMDGPEARIKTAQLLPYGARLDLKLIAPIEEPASVLLQFSARTT